MHWFCRCAVRQWLSKLRFATHQRGAKIPWRFAAAGLSVFFALFNVWKSSRCPAACFPSFALNTRWQYTVQCCEGKCSCPTDVTTTLSIAVFWIGDRGANRSTRVNVDFFNFTRLKMKARHKFSGESDVLVGHSLDELRVGRGHE
jgi:hypothetical protein